MKYRAFIVGISLGLLVLSVIVLAFEGSTF
jgi:hypothetical protein